jgi:hypothetical protein
MPATPCQKTPTGVTFDDNYAINYGVNYAKNYAIFAKTTHKTTPIF